MRSFSPDNTNGWKTFAGRGVSGFRARGQGGQPVQETVPEVAGGAGEGWRFQDARDGGFCRLEALGGDGDGSSTRDY